MRYIEFLSDSPEIISKIDRTQLIQFITNLAKNAIQSIPEQQEKSVLVRIRKENNNVLITVTDNGIGIQPKTSTEYSNLNLPQK
jgi:C4-dicarboxylate-specific signal transduction histidine kinase